MAAAGVIGLAAGAVAVALATQGSAAPAPATADKAAIEAVVHDYLLAHPEVIPEAMARYRDNQTAKSIADNRHALETPFAGAWAGNPKGDVTLVEFTDYACGFCRASVPAVERLLAEDKGLRVVYRELAIISDLSKPAGEAALAAAKAGRHAAFHRTLFGAGPLSTETLARAEQAARVTPAALTDPALGKELDDDVALARAIDLTGTPTFVIGNQILSGAVGYDALKQAIANARHG